MALKYCNVCNVRRPLAVDRRYAVPRSTAVTTVNCRYALLRELQLLFINSILVQQNMVGLRAYMRVPPDEPESPLGRFLGASSHRIDGLLTDIYVL